MVGIWGCRGASSVGCLLSLIPASSRNKEGGKTEVMAEVVIVLGIRNAVSQIIYKISGGDIRHRKEGRDIKKIRQTNSPTTKFVTSVTSTLCLRVASGWRSKQIRARIGGRNNAISIIFMQARHTSRAQGPGATRGHVIGCEYE
jgi:hypothetical protein